MKVREIVKKLREQHLAEFGVEMPHKALVEAVFAYAAANGLTMNVPDKVIVMLDSIGYFEDNKG